MASARSDDEFPVRLAEAIGQLPPERRAGIRARMDELRIGGGLKAGIARLVGLRSPSLLSDMLAGRARGERCRAQLAALLGVSEAWLAGDDRDAPPWRQLPGEYWLTWARPLREAWARRCGFALGGEEAGASPLERAHSDSERFSGAAQPAIDRRAIARAVLVSPADEAVDELARGRFERVPFDLLLALADHLGTPRPSHPEHARAGHAALGEALRHREWLARELAARLRRHALPPRLFQLARLALSTLKSSRAYQGKDVEAVDDCLELLWRQQLQPADDPWRDTPDPPPAFTDETSRPRWTPSRTLRARYDADADPFQRYASG